MFVGYVLKKTASGTTSYIVESPSGASAKQRIRVKQQSLVQKRKLKK